MAITERENILKFYKHEHPDHLPDTRYLRMVPIFGYPERPIDPRVAKMLQLDTERFPQYQVSMKDWFGVEYVTEPDSGAMPDCTKTPVLTDITKWREQVKFPDLDAYDVEDAYLFDHIDTVDREKEVLLLMVQCGIYERFHALAGMENAMMWMLEEPEETAELLSAIADFKMRMFEKLIKYYKPDILRQHDDYGAQHAMQMSPDLWRKMIKPHIARFVKLCHDNGVFYEQHSCGFMEPIVPDFVEIGVDCWNGMHINDVLKLKEITGGKLNFHMSLDHQRYMADDYAGKLTEESLRKDIRQTITACAKGGSYVPTLALAGGDNKWWGAAVIRDELARCLAEVEV